MELPLNDNKQIMKLSKLIKWQIYRENTMHCSSYILF